MAKTRHFQQRMSQRGIKQDTVDLVLKYGAVENDRVVLNRKDLKSLVSHLTKEKKVAAESLEKGGHVVVVGKNDALITTYRLDSFRRKLRG